MNKKGVIICDKHIRFIEKTQDPGSNFRRPWSHYILSKLLQLH